MRAHPAPPAHRAAPAGLVVGPADPARSAPRLARTPCSMRRNTVPAARRGASRGDSAPRTASAGPASVRCPGRLLQPPLPGVDRSLAGPSVATCINCSPAQRARETGRKARPPRCMLAAAGPGRRCSSLTRVCLQAACLMPIDVAVVEGAPPLLLLAGRQSGRRTRRSWCEGTLLGAALARA
jgi:hypothetical protein